ncbi:MAG TPA: GNAT family N-acetyltransferase [Acidobacteriaceae bacterium]|nr:GNAT family N-acetyltransferase [Acidobacteriaceae bacterium]
MLLRSAEPEDALAVARVHVRAWRAAYRSLLPDRYLDDLRAEDRAKVYDFTHSDPSKPQTIVAVEAGLIQGFASIMPYRGADLKEFGELCALYVDPEYWGRGMGATLISAARARLLASGFDRAALWVLDGNVRAHRFYRMDGWIPDGERRAETAWGVVVNESRYKRRLTNRPTQEG